MKGIYFEGDDILQIRASDRPITREVSQDWYANISYAEHGTAIEVVLLDAEKERLLPLKLQIGNMSSYIARLDRLIKSSPISINPRTFLLIL